MVGDTAPALPPLNIHAKPASDAVRNARRDLFMAKHYRTAGRGSRYEQFIFNYWIVHGVKMVCLLASPSFCECSNEK
jgi:hypothetical protein